MAWVSLGQAQPSRVMPVFGAIPDQRLGCAFIHECVLTIRGGKVVHERRARAAVGQDTLVYDLLFKHGHLGEQHEVVDIGIVDNRIARMRRVLKTGHARVVVEAEGCEVAPVALA